MKFNENAILATFEIVLQYSSFKITEVIHTFNCELHKQGKIKNDTNISLKAIINLISNTDVFIFRNECYKQTKGAPVGSPIFGLHTQFNPFTHIYYFSLLFKRIKQSFFVIIESPL